MASPVDRASYLAEACGDNQALRARVEGLLKVYAEEKSFAGMPVRGSGHHRASADQRTARHGHRAVQADGADRRGRIWTGVCRRTAAAGPSQGRAQGDQAGHGHPRRDRPLRGRAASPGADGPPEHRAGVRRGRDRLGPPVLCHGAGPRRSHHGVLRPAAPHAARAAGIVRLPVPRHPARASKRDHSPRRETHQRAGHGARRPAGRESDRLRRGQGAQPAAYASTRSTRSSRR